MDCGNRNKVRTPHDVVRFSLVARLRHILQEVKDFLKPLGRVDAEVNRLDVLDHLAEHAQVLHDVRAEARLSDTEGVQQFVNKLLWIKPEPRPADRPVDAAPPISQDRCEEVEVGVGKSRKDLSAKVRTRLVAGR